MTYLGRAGALVAAIAVVVAACGGEDAQQPVTAPPASTPRTPPPTTPPPSTGPPATTRIDPPALLARSDAVYAPAQVAAAEMAELIAGNTGFALSLLRATATEGENLILSPHSVAGALMMAYAGAGGETASQMEQALSLSLPDATVHDARNELDRLIKEPGRRTPDDDREPLSINVVNALWGQRGFEFERDFLDILSRSYDTGVRLVDFVADPSGAARRINDWAAQETEGRIEDLIPDGALTTDTRVVLTNAIWFKANWLARFDPALTSDGGFHLADGSTVTVPLMHGGGRMQYLAGDGFEATRIAYAGDASMLVIAPAEGRYTEVVAELDFASLSAIRADLSTHQVDLTMPVFSFESQLSLVAALTELGMVDAFSHPPADFGGISSARDDLYIQDVVHKAFISVDEEGTEAAAATAVIVGITSAPPPASLTLDRPFVFLIQHDPTGEILFVGQVADPA